MDSAVAVDDRRSTAGAAVDETSYSVHHWNLRKVAERGLHRSALAVLSA